MGRKKGSKNKQKVEVEIVEATESVVEPVEVPVEESKEAVLDWREELKFLRQRMQEVNPDCGRGGCLHPRDIHDDTGECHKCNCMRFIKPE